MSLSATLIYLLVAVTRAQSTDLTQYVLPSTGAANGGNTFSGVSMPFGMVKLGADVFFGADSYSGNVPIGNFTGFSMMHESGTGGAPKYGVVSQMPVIGNIENPLDDHNDTRSAPDNTTVGYYRASLGSGITVELSATSRAGFFQYTFPTGNQANVLIDVSHVLPSYRKMGLSQNYLGGNITTSQNHYEGYGDYDNGWNRAPKWRIYFCGYFDTPGTTKTFVGQNKSGSAIDQYGTASNVISTARLGAVFSFNASAVTSRVGISFISASQACSNVNSQIPLGTTLSQLTSNARKTWNDEVLSKVTTTEIDEDNLRLLYTSMYHMHLLPSNRTGENPLWKSSEPYYDDTFTTWDLFRCTFPLFQIFQPHMYEEYIRSLIDIFRFEGYMPDARSSNYNGATQGGSNSDNVLADAYVKGVRGAVDWATGYSAMVKNAEVTPTNNNDPRDLSSSTKEGRGALPDWLELGYITPKYGRSVTRAIEYSVNDFSLYQVASGLGKAADAKKYVSRSRNWRNHWNPTATALNLTGFMVPRTRDGFVAQDILSCGGCYWADAYYEALPWEYSFNAHHDMNTLIALSGGPENFISRLEMTFTPGINTSGRSGGFNNTIFNPGNEPSFTTPYLYNFVGRQDLSVKRSRYIAQSYYSPTPGGLPGNSDAGAMESWLIWNMLGLYPVTGQTTFLIGSPWFSNTTISLDSGKTLKMTAVGGTNTSFYVQSLTVNGKQWTQAWVTYDEIFSNGGTIDFILGSEPKYWATGPAPPSPASEFSDSASPTSIVDPAKVSMAPSLEVQEKRHRRRILLRNIAFGLMGLAIFGVGIGSWTVWWFWCSKGKKSIDDQIEGKLESQAGQECQHKESERPELEASKRKGFTISRPWKRILLGLKQTRRGVIVEQESTQSTSKSDGKDANKEKLDLKIDVREVGPQPLEPWTPRGTNLKQ